MTPEFLQAAIPKPYTILGLDLLPLSIGHFYLFHFQDLAYIGHADNGREKVNRRPTMDDLISGCLICSMKFREYQEFLKRPDLPQRLKKLGKNIDLATLPAKHCLFDQYLAQGSTVPEVEMPDSVTSSLLCGTPWLQALRVFLMARLHVRAEETFDYPYAAAVADCFALREADGKLVINGGQTETQEMQDTIAVLQAMNEQLRERLAAGGTLGP